MTAAQITTINAFGATLPTEPATSPRPRSCHTLPNINRHRRELPPPLQRNSTLSNHLSTHNQLPHHSTVSTHGHTQKTHTITQQLTNKNNVIFLPIASLCLILQNLNASTYICEITTYEIDQNAHSHIHTHMLNAKHRLGTNALAASTAALEDDGSALPGSKPTFSETAWPSTSTVEHPAANT